MRKHTIALSAIATAVALSFGCSTAEKAGSAVAATMDKAKAAVTGEKTEPPPTLGGASGEMLANTCAGCHGTHGASTGPATPSIGGLSTEYFVETMKAYKSGDRAATIMDRIAKGYDEAEFKAMADYYGAQPFVGQIQTSEGPEAHAGKALHEEYCEKCHEDGGRSVEDDSGLLAGQWMPYLHWTLDDIVAGRSKVSESKMMKALEKMTAEHGPDSIVKLVNYYGSHK